MARPVRASDGAYRQLDARGSVRLDRQGGRASRRPKLRSVEAPKLSQRPRPHGRRDQLPHRLPDEKSVSAHGAQAPHRRPEGVPVPGHTAFEKVAAHETGTAGRESERSLRDRIGTTQGGAPEDDRADGSEDVRTKAEMPYGLRLAAQSAPQQGDRVHPGGAPRMGSRRSAAPSRDYD